MQFDHIASRKGRTQKYPLQDLGGSFVLGCLRQLASCRAIIIWAEENLLSHLSLKKRLCDGEMYARMAQPSLPIWRGVHHTKPSNRVDKAPKNASPLELID